MFKVIDFLFGMILRVLTSYAFAGHLRNHDSSVPTDTTV